MSEDNPENTQVPAQELTPEQIQEKVQAIQSAVVAFNADSRHERYKFTVANRAAIDGYLKAHSLEYATESLHLAFADLSKTGALELFEESKLPTPDPPREKTSERELPPVGRATGADLGCGLADMQRARKNVDGVLPSNNREAFMNAAEKAANQKVRGGRFHL